MALVRFLYGYKTIFIIIIICMFMCTCAYVSAHVKNSKSGGLMISFENQLS